MSLNSRGAALLMEMGTGKSLTAIAITGALSQAGRIRRVLIVAPLSILGVWEEEFQKFAAFPYALAVLSGSSAKKLDTLRHMNGTALQVVVVNYESAWRLEKALTAWHPDLIIADEGHKIKTHNIAASKAMHRMGTKASYRLLLTGTVITNKAIDVFSQYKFLNPAIYGNSFYAFRNRYFDMVGYGNHTPVLKKSMESELTEKLHSISYRATKAECLDLPETTDMIRQIELEPAALRIYRGLVKESYAELAGGEVTATNILTRLLRLSQLTGGFLGNDETAAVEQVSAAKLSALEDILDGAVAEGKKLVIIARFIPEIKAICKLLEKRGLGYSCITGEVKNRDEQVARFQNEPEVMAFVGQIATAGLGITLTAASTMVFYSLDYSMSNFEQTKARIHRVGQRMPCTYLYLVARGTVDEKVLAALESKADLARTLVDDYRSGRNPFAA
ncbi:DEAD/DEAH box helicase [Ruminococcus bromii]|uniref:DEAD/DEAH box helicase n=1 Tax=Ruminococcus bromii TaxID=40518 RepID=UPI00292D8A15|nr:DEAD/DEAH box helicase [Ruminococcus bromii]MDE8725960.1 DEAD/DEAH box helicase [Ruminococcus bromii]